MPRTRARVCGLSRRKDEAILLVKHAYCWLHPYSMSRIEYTCRVPTNEPAAPSSPAPNAAERIFTAVMPGENATPDTKIVWPSEYASDNTGVGSVRDWATIVYVRGFCGDDVPAEYAAIDLPIVRRDSRTVIVVNTENDVQWAAAFISACRRVMASHGHVFPPHERVEAQPGYGRSGVYTMLFVPSEPAEIPVGTWTGVQ